MGVGGAVRGVVRGVFRAPLKLETQNSNFLNPEPQAAKGGKPWHIPWSPTRRKGRTPRSG